MLSEKMGLLGKAEMNSLVAGNMYKAGVNAPANAILDKPRFVVILMASALNEYLAKQTETFTQIIKENAEKIKQEATELSIIAGLIQSQTKDIHTTFKG